MSDRRRLTALVLSVVAVLVLAGCSKTETVASSGGKAGHRWVRVHTVVKDDNGKVKKDGTRGPVRVSDAEYKVCRKGARWPDCKDAAAKPKASRRRPPKQTTAQTVTIHAHPVSAAGAQRYIDGGNQCRAAQYSETAGGLGTGHIILGHGLNAIRACHNRAATWYGLHRGALVVVANGPFAGRYRVVGHTETHALGPAAPPDGAYKHALAMGSCETDRTTGWTFAERA